MSKTLQDMIPKFLMHLMVNHSKLFIKEDLLACLYREAGKEDLMEENAAETQRRIETMGMCVQHTTHEYCVTAGTGTAP